MILFKKYFDLQEQIYNYFGYKEDWCVIPLNDCTDMYWYLVGEGPGKLYYAYNEKDLLSKDQNYYCDYIYTPRFLPKWVYRGEEYTMVCCNPHEDGNKFLRILDNSKEVKI